MIQSLNYLFVTVVFLLFIVELIIDRKEHRHLYKQKDTLQTIYIAAGLFLVGFLNRTITLAVYFLLYSVRLCTLEENGITWVAAILLADFCFYWYHRSAHSINWFWASHSVHHSSEQFNLSVAFRHSWVYVISGQFLFWAWMPLLGFHPILVFCAIQICTFYQGWLHTELIGKLHPIFEWVFNTPSHHRVHHGSDLKYLDKNSGAIFIVWDRLFGTFQQEEEKPTYGLTKKSKSATVYSILSGDWTSLFSKAFSSGSLSNATKYFLKPPGWSPDGSTKTVNQLRAAAKHKAARKKCDGNCSNCPFMKTLPQMKTA